MAEPFGVLKRVDLRRLWPGEARDFTPWLAQNIGVLGDSLGLDLELRLQEASVGPFSLDLLAHDLGRDRAVIIENQLEQADHDHLCKLLTYSAGYDAAVAIWVAPGFRDEHRQSLDWLNQRTDVNTEFFGVVIEALQIDDSRPAAIFRLVASLNDWRKTNITRDDTKRSARGEAYRTFFQGLMDQLRETHNFTKARKAQAQNWHTFSSGTGGVGYGFSFAAGGVAQAETYIDRGDVVWNKWLFDALYAERDEIEANSGEPLIWKRLDERQGCRIAVKRRGSIDDSPDLLRELQDWAIVRLLRFRNVIGPRASSLPRVGPPSSASTGNSATS